MKRMGEVGQRITILGVVLIVAGVCIAAQPVAHEIVGRVSAVQAKGIWKKWKQKCRSVDITGATKPGDPELWLRVPSCRISSLVLAESDPNALHRFPAARCLNGGGVVIYAHRDTHFRGLARIEMGDRIRSEKADGTWTTYQVRSTQILLPEQVNAALAFSETDDSLYLLTCYPFRYLGAAPQRFLVTATKSRD